MIQQPGLHRRERHPGNNAIKVFGALSEEKVRQTLMALPEKYVASEILIPKNGLGR